MKHHFRRTRMLLSMPRLIPHIVVLLCTSKSNFVWADLTRWAEELYLEIPQNSFDRIWLLIELLTFYPEYRNIFYLRCGRYAAFMAWLCPRLSTLQIVPGDIGPGLFIQHGVATLIAAQKIGANCWINQQVTIGFSDRTNSPTIGDNVRISAGATIVGNATIGDNVTVGANTAVIGDVPPNATVLGVPARVVWMKDRDPIQEGVKATANAPVSRNEWSSSRVIQDQKQV